MSREINNSNVGCEVLLNGSEQKNFSAEIQEDISQPKSKKIVMNENLPKKSVKELFIVGIASASVFLSGSALALGNTNNSSSNQSFDNPTSLADSSVRSKEVLAQAPAEDNQRQPSPGDVSPRENPPVSPDGSSGERPSSSSEGSSGVGSPQPSDAKPRGSSPPPTGKSPTDSSSSGAASGPKPGTWLCINNPNSSCRG